MASLYPIDLFRGWPASELIPVDSLKEAAINALSNKSISDAGFGYGPDEGYHPLRKNIAKWLTEYYGPQETITSNRICITGGASQNLASILQVFTDPLQTEMIWLVEPTYHLVFRTFADAGFHGRMRGIPENEFGMDVHALERALEELADTRHDENPHASYVRYLAALLLWSHVPNLSQVGKPALSYRKIYKHIIYCVPSFSNPSGTTMTRSRREALVRVARKHDALVICDDVYDFLAWAEGTKSKLIGHSLQRLVDIDRILDGGPVDAFGNVVSNGSFSKLLGPGCRVGWAEGSEAFVYGLSQA
jgi:DNA-binding transcriptional MocR family regulator